MYAAATSPQVPLRAQIQLMKHECPFTLKITTKPYEHKLNPETGNPSCTKPTANSTDMDMEIFKDDSDDDNNDDDDEEEEEDGFSPSNAGQNAATLVGHQ